MASARLVLPWLFPAWMTTSPASRSNERGSVPKALEPADLQRHQPCRGHQTVSRSWRGSWLPPGGDDGIKGASSRSFSVVA